MPEEMTASLDLLELMAHLDPRDHLYVNVYASSFLFMLPIHALTFRVLMVTKDLRDPVEIVDIRVLMVPLEVPESLEMMQDL